MLRLPRQVHVPWVVLGGHPETFMQRVPFRCMTLISARRALLSGALGLQWREQKTLIQLRPTCPRSRPRSVARRPCDFYALHGLGYTLRLVPAEINSLLWQGVNDAPTTPLKALLVSFVEGLQPPVRLKRATLRLKVQRSPLPSWVRSLILLKPRYNFSETVGNRTLSPLVCWQLTL